MIESYHLMWHVEGHQCHGLETCLAEGARVTPTSAGGVCLQIVRNSSAHCRCDPAFHHFWRILYPGHVPCEDCNFRMGDHLKIEHPRVQVFQLIQVAFHITP